MVYERSRIAIDAVIFTIQEDQLKIFLRRREKEPFKEKYELPGGLLKEKETAEDTLRRKIKETIDIEEIFFQQFFTFTEPKRDPRSRTVSIGFIALIDHKKIKDSSNWYKYGSFKELAFDHKKIIDKARNHLKKEINSIIVREFMPRLFTLNSLQKAYEVILEEKQDNRNFRRRMINSGIVIETKQIEKNVSHRPAKLYRFK